MHSSSFDPAAILRELKAQIALYEQVLTVITQEHKALAEPGEPSRFNTFQQRKDLIPLLDKSLDSLHAIRMEWQKLNPSEQADYPEIGGLMRTCQELIMKIIVLDRENEQNLLKKGLIPLSQLPSLNRSRPHFVAGLYQRHTGH